MRPVKAKISITLDNDLLDQLRVLSEEDERSLSQYINLLLRRDVTKILKERSGSPNRL